MVIHSKDAATTDIAMMRTKWPDSTTNGTVGKIGDFVLLIVRSLISFFCITLLGMPTR